MPSHGRAAAADEEPPRVARGGDLEGEGLHQRDGSQEVLPCTHLTEDALLALEGFARFERQLGPCDPATNPADRTLLEATRALLTAGVSTGAPDPASDVAAPLPRPMITDALLPGFCWLLGRYPRERVETFGAALADLLRPQAPLLVYLAGDVRALLQRAAAQRGAAWLERMPAWVARWNLPHYPHAPLRDLEDVVRLWGWLNDRTLELLARWPGEALILDAMRPARSLTRDVLRHLGERGGDP